MERNEQTVFSKAEFEQTAVKVSNVSIIGNTVLTVFKLLAGILAHSGAMVSDAVHSASDVLSSFVVIIGVKVASRASDETHPYGHERFESVAAIILAIILCFTGLFIGHTAIEKLTAGAEAELTVPGVLALVAAIVSIVLKEAMYWYTRHFAKKIDSGALMAEAWHHRSDALSSVGSLIGICGARMGLKWFDPVASLLICGFIVKAAYDIFTNAIEKMVDHSCSPEMQENLRQYALSQAGVMGIKRLRGREFGNRIYVELELYADGSITLYESSKIAERVHRGIEKEFPKVKHILVRVDAAPEDPVQN